MLKAIQYLVLRKGFALLNRALGIAEHVIFTLTSDSPISSVWIIGSPRSGTTLLYQVLISRYRLAYFSNFTARFYQAPIIATWIERALFFRSKRAEGYTSQHGQTKGWLGPNEAGAFWYRWFPKGDYVYVPPGTIPEVHLKELRQEVSGMSKVAKAPVIFKNTYNSMRIAPIVEAFPEACFLVCRRNRIDTAQSILNARIETSDDRHAWWSLPPKEIEEIKNHPPCKQVVEQVYYTYEQIRADRCRFGKDRFLDVKYEALCKDTHSSLERIESFLIRRGVEIRAHRDVPGEFQVSTGQRISDEDYQCILAATAELEDS